MGTKVADIGDSCRWELDRLKQIGSWRRRQEAGLALAFLLLVNQCVPSALAFRLPEGSWAIQRRLGDDPSNKSKGPAHKFNLSYMPVLLDLAKILGRFQPPPHMFFFIENESFSNYPGIDLRGLLLSKAGLLKVPESAESPDAGKPAQASEAPQLAVPPLEPEASGDGKSQMNDGSVPQLAVRTIGGTDSVQPTQPPAQVASPDQIKLSLQGNELSSSPSLSFDFHGISKAANRSGEPLNISPADLPQLRSSFPTLIAFGEAVHNATPFLFWTCHQGKPSLAGKEQVEDRSKTNASFKGTFVACRDKTGISWIRNRHIGLQHGRVLASNRGGDLGIDTALGSVSIDAGASAVVEYGEQKVLRVMALESSAPARVVVDVRKPNGSIHSVRLSQGEALVVGEHSLNKEDIQGADGVNLTDAQELEQSIRARFEVSDLLNKEVLLDQSNPELSAEQRSALVELRDRLARRNMADQPRSD